DSARFEPDLAQHPDPSELRPAGPGEERPACNFRRAVPARVRVAVRDRKNRTVVGTARPREPVRTVRVRARPEPQVDERSPGAIELGHIRLMSPPDEEVTVGENLRVSLVDGEKRR